MTDRIRDKRTQKRYFADNIVVDDYGPHIKIYAFAVYHVLCRYADLQDQTCYPSHATIAEKLACSVGKVKSALKTLKEYGLIDWEQRFNNGGQTSNLYTLLDPPSHVVATPSHQVTTPSSRGDDPGGHDVTTPQSPGGDEQSLDEQSSYDQSSEEQAPDGAGLWKPVIHDLDNVLYYLEGTGYRKDEATALCPCGETNTQEMNVCPECGRPVVWEHSRVWKRLYGKPADYLRKLRGEDLKAVTPLQVYACRVFGRRGEFSNVTQQRDFLRLEKQYPDDYLRGLIKWADGRGFHAFVAGAENEANWKKYQMDVRKKQEKEEIHDDADDDGGDIVAQVQEWIRTHNP